MEEKPTNNKFWREERPPVLLVGMYVSVAIMESCGSSSEN